MGRKYVLDGAILECNAGMAPAKLMVVTNQRVKIQGKFKATHMDRLVPQTFVQCKLKPTPGGFLPCTPMLLPWLDTAKKTNLRGMLKFIYDDSYSMCGFGGKVTVVHPMQINAAGAAFEQYTNISTTIPGAMPLAGFDEGTLPKEDSGNSFLDGFQTMLDIAGLVPGFGEIADGINAAIYVARGDYANAALSAAAMIPIGGQAATAAKLGMKGADVAKTAVKNADEVVEGVLKGKTVFLKGFKNISLKYTKRTKEAAAALRRKFNSTERKKFLKDIANNPEKVKKLKESGLDADDIKLMKDGGVPEGFQVHHKLPLDDGGDNSFNNLVLIKNDPYHKALTNKQKELTKGMKPGDTRVIEWPVVDGFVYP